MVCTELCPVTCCKRHTQHSPLRLEGKWCQKKVEKRKGEKGEGVVTDSVVHGDLRQTEFGGKEMGWVAIILLWGVTSE